MKETIAIPNHSQSKDLNDSFDNDLFIVDYEYQVWGNSLVDNQAKLFEELKDAIGENRERIIENLQKINSNVLKWNLFVESYIDKYLKEEKLKSLLENYLIQPQR